jgi:serine beta-lactamase-like protein LACTB, mitochondrial
VLAQGLLNEASIRMMVTPQRLPSGTSTLVGIGWRVGSDSTFGTYYHHGGTSNGGSAFLLVVPGRQLVIAMAANALADFRERDALMLARLLTP